MKRFIGLLAAVLLVAGFVQPAHAQGLTGTGNGGTPNNCIDAAHRGWNAWEQGCGNGTATGQNYDLGEAGSLNASQFQQVVQGFSASLSPMLPALIPVAVVILAIWLGPGLLRSLLRKAAS